MTLSPLVAAIRRGLALAVLIGFVVGVPAALAAAGSPLPSRWPSWAHVITDFRVGYVPSAAVTKVAIGAAWCAWLFLVYEFAAEISCRLRRHAGRRASALGVLQPLVAKLVAALVLSAPMAGKPSSAVTPLVTLADVVHLMSSSSTSTTGDTAGLPLPGTTAVALPTYVVRPHDTLWGIAQRHLGDPLRWSEIAALNEGRPEGAGQFGDPAWIYPGWVLVLPADATGLVDIQAADAVLPEAYPSEAAPIARHYDAMFHQASYLGGEDQSPPTPEAVPGPVTASAGRDARSATGNSGAGLQRRAPAIVGVAVMAAGVVALLEGARRVQQRRRKQGRRIVLPRGELADLELQLRTTADYGAMTDIDVTNRLLAEHVRCAVGSVPSVVSVRCRPDFLEFTFDPATIPDHATAPFRAEGPSTWLVDRSELPAGESAEARMVAGGEPAVPVLVTVGSDDVGPVLVNLEAAGTLCVTGVDGEMILQGMVVELATMPWSDPVDIVVIGHSGRLIGLDRVRQAGSIAAVVPEVERRIDNQRRLEMSAQAASTPQARWREPDERWDPLVIVCLPAATDAEPVAASRLTAAVEPGNHGVVAVMGGGELNTRWRAHVDRGQISLVANGGTAARELQCGVPDQLRTAEVPGGLLQGVDDLVHMTSASDGGPLEPVGGQARGSGDLADSAEPRRADAEVEVLVLGPVEIAGAARPFARAWALELVVYLAMHPRNGAATEEWMAALWPDRFMAPASLHSTASAARRALGSSSTTGEDHLPRAHGRLKLGPGVSSDWARFAVLTASESPADWMAALSLVRGRPFQGLRSADWTVLEGIVATIEATVVDVGCRLGEHFLASGDAQSAERAARQALKVSPYDERLFRVLLRAADVGGNPAGVESTMQELVRLVADDVEPFGESVHPETLELYRRLSRRSAARRGA